MTNQTKAPRGEKKVLSEQFNISEPMRFHHVLEVKGLKFTVSLKELDFLKDLLTIYLRDNHDQKKYQFGR